MGFIPEMKNPSIVELSVLSAVAGCLRSNAIIYGRTKIAVFLLLNVPHVLDYAAADTTLEIVLHYVWIGPFRFEGILTSSSEG